MTELVLAEMECSYVTYILDLRCGHPSPTLSVDNLLTRLGVRGFSCVGGFRFLTGLFLNRGCSFLGSLLRGGSLLCCS